MKIPDAAQRTRALDPRTSFIVQAPAGSGKTELLIQRYLTLLGTVAQPEGVVAITFTRKAAGEMRRRVLTALENSTGPRPAEPHEALTWQRACGVRHQSEKFGWDLSRNPGRLRIQTIDSLCASLTRQMPWLSRLGGPPDIVEDGTELYAEAARRTIALLEKEQWSGEVEILLRHLDNDFAKVQNLLAGMLARRDQWLRHVALHGAAEESRAALETALRRVILDGVEKARDLIPKPLRAELVAVTAAAGKNLLAEGRPGRAGACADQADLPEGEDVERWLGIVDTLLTHDDEWRKRLSVREGFPTSDKLMKQRCTELISALQENEPLRLTLVELRHLPGAEFADPQWEVLKALVRLLPIAAGELQSCFRERGAADYVEVAVAAQRALGDSSRPTDMALSLDCRIEHLLIDEFQDTSVSQYSLLERLTAGWKAGDGRTIFAVGDPMQSIYRFREAEVGLFLKASREGIGKVPLEPVRLSVNFRSDQGVVDWVNETFPGILPPDEDITTGAISYAPSEAVHELRLDPAVRIHPFIGASGEAEAARVVELVQSARDRNKSVAILIRARTHASFIVEALRAAGLRFRAVELDSLAELPVIRDLTALTRLLMHPADRIAWLALLRAPWCGLTLEELHVIAGADPKAAIWDLMRDGARLQSLSAEAHERLSRVRSVLEDALVKRPPSLRSWVEGVWMALGGPACTRTATELQNAEAFFEVLEEMDEARTLDLAAFQEAIGQLYAKSDSEADESLQVMTIHKAKGLEFDVVIVPGLGRRPRNEDAPLMRWLERPRLAAAPDLLLAPISATGADEDPTYGYLKRVDNLKSSHESGRLLYVAATRAKSELHLLGQAGYAPNKAGILELKPPAPRSLLSHLWPAVAPVFEEALETFWLPPEEEKAERKPQVIQRLSPGWHLPAPPPTALVPARSPVTAESEASAVSFDWVGDTLRHIGTVVHQMLRCIAENGCSKWDVHRIQQYRTAYLSALATLGVPATDLPAAVDRVEAALTQTLLDERGQWLLGSHDEAACEYAFCGLLEGEFVNARIDRTFVDDQGTRWVIDYKSSAHEGAAVEAFLDNERERYREQMARYRRLFAGMEERPIRAALYFPLLNGWREVE